MSEHTPTPLRVVYLGSEGSLIKPDTGDKEIDRRTIATFQDSDDADYFLKAVNCHDELLEALGKCLITLEAQQGEWVSVQIPHCPLWVVPLKDTAEIIRAAIAKAKGEK